MVRRTPCLLLVALLWGCGGSPAGGSSSGTGSAGGSGSGGATGGSSSSGQSTATGSSGITSSSSGASTTSSSASGTSGSSSGTSSSSSSSGSSSGGSCTPALAATDNGDLGTACTGTATDGGLAQGSCAAGEVCDDPFGDGSPRCYAIPDLVTGSCPGTSVKVGDRCFPDCDPAIGLCPGGLACDPLSPGLHEAGVCYAACFTDADCNGPLPDGGAPGTHRACDNGSCRCTRDSDCSRDGSRRCDTTSGACYTPCPGSGTCSQGCCANTGAVQYCDGQASGACPAGSIVCGAHCVDPSSDDLHCGDCGTPCTGGTHCFAGQCQTSNIKHVVLIVQENHTFDSYFGNYCAASAGSHPTCTTGRSCCEHAPLTWSNDAPKSLDDSENCGKDHNHTYACETCQIDDGGMDHYLTGGCPGSSSLISYGCSDPGNFATAPSSQVSTYWGYADNGALAARYFQPIASSSSANDMYFAVARYQFLDNSLEPNAVGRACLYGGPGSPVDTATPVTLTGETIADLLLHYGYTFAVYAGGYADAVAAAPACPAGASDCFTVDSCRFIDYACKYDPADIPFEYYAQFQDNPTYMKDLTRFQSDVDSGNLPDFAYVKYRTYRNEHPGHAYVSTGEASVDQIVQAIESSPLYASNTLVLLTWDEGGGFFDHVSPPASIENFPPGDPRAGQPVPYGTRVPMIAIGPFARTGGISHVTMEHSSVVRFLEYNFLGPGRVGALGARDAKVNDIGSLLDPSKTGVTIPATH